MVVAHGAKIGGAGRRVKCSCPRLVLALVLLSFCTFNFVSAHVSFASPHQSSPSNQPLTQQYLQQVHLIHESLAAYNQPGPDLLMRLGASERGSRILMEGSVTEGGIDPLKNDDAEFATEVCRADAIVVGTPVSHYSFLSKNHSTVITDYKIQLASIIRDSSKAPLVTDHEIVLTTPGGTVTMPEGTIEQHPALVSPLIRGHSYIFFLRYIPQSGQYGQADVVNQYDVSDNRRVDPTNAELFEASSRKASLAVETPMSFGSRLAVLARSCPSGKSN